MISRSNPKIWVTRENDRIPLIEMEDSHLERAIPFIVGRIELLETKQKTGDPAKRYSEKMYKEKLDIYNKNLEILKAEVERRNEGLPSERNSGVCHCGESMEGHSLYSNHSPKEMIMPSEVVSLEEHEFDCYCDECIPPGAPIPSHKEDVASRTASELLKKAEEGGIREYEEVKKKISRLVRFWLENSSAGLP